MLNDFPEGHALHGVPDEILGAARHVLDDASVWKDVDPELADPIADSVVMALLPWLVWTPDQAKAALADLSGDVS